MADITPFKGILYNPEKIKNLADVCTPPYDVISKEEQEDFYNRHPNNIIRLILGKPDKFDTETNNPHTRAAGYFNEWLSQNILVEDNTPAIYLTAVEFLVNGETVRRHGMIVRVRLEPFEKGIILPHEKTFSKVKSERLNLIKACHANFSPIFSIYQDTENSILNRLKHQTKQHNPDMDFFDSKGLRQTMWRIIDESLQAFITEAMADKILFIADGHHRYETALNYRNWVFENNPDFSDDHPANFVMMYLSCMDEPGLTIFPAHRLIKGIDDSALSSFVDKAKQYFDITRFSYNEDNKNTIQKEFSSLLEKNHSEKTIGVCLKNRHEFYLLKTKPNIMEELFSNDIADPLINLDVTVLTQLIFINILGFDMKRLDNEKLISYTSNAEEAVNKAFKAECDMSFILNPTKIEQVKQVAEAGLIMPRKSTYFYPKVITGQAMYKLY